MVSTGLLLILAVLGVPGALAFTGALILGLAVVSTRLTRAARQFGPAKPDGEQLSGGLPKAA